MSRFAYVGGAAVLGLAASYWLTKRMQDEETEPDEAASEGDETTVETTGEISDNKIVEGTAPTEGNTDDAVQSGGASEAEPEPDATTTAPDEPASGDPAPTRRAPSPGPRDHEDDRAKDDDADNAEAVKRLIDLERWRRLNRADDARRRIFV